MLTPGDPVYIACYALTKGIMKATAQVVSGSRVRCVENHWTTFVIGTQAFGTLQEAVDVAEKARLARIESLKKQIAKLETLDVSAKIKEWKNG